MFNFNMTQDSSVPLQFKLSSISFFSSCLSVSQFSHFSAGAFPSCPFNSSPTPLSYSVSQCHLLLGCPDTSPPWVSTSSYATSLDEFLLSSVPLTPPPLCPPFPSTFSCLSMPTFTYPTSLQQFTVFQCNPLQLLLQFMDL